MMLRKDMIADLNEACFAMSMAQAELFTLPFWRFRTRRTVEDKLLRAEAEAAKLRKVLYGGKATDAQGCLKEGLEGGRTIDGKGKTAKGQEGGKE
jgi:hypothetical protein